MTSEHFSGHHSGTILEDDGCEVHPRCLECPLQMCRYDDPKWYKQWLRQKHIQKVMDRKQEGASVNELVMEFSVTPRTIFRMVRESHLASA